MGSVRLLSSVGGQSHVDTEPLCAPPFPARLGEKGPQLARAAKGTLGRSAEPITEAFSSELKGCFWKSRELEHEDTPIVSKSMAGTGQVGL